MTTRTMTAGLAAAMAAALLACGGSASRDGQAAGSAKLTIALTGTSVDAVHHVELHVTGAAFDELVTAERSGNEFQVELTKIPAGGYEVEANAYDAAGMLLYHTLEPVAFTVEAGLLKSVPILLQQVAPPPFLNGAPFISAFQASSDVVDPIHPQLALAAQFMDADAATGGGGDTIAWTWSATCGAFAPVEAGGDDATGTTTESPRTVAIAWTGDCVEPVTITLTVEDAAGQKAALSETFQPSAGYGGAYVATSFNDWPVIGAMLLDNSQLAPGSTHAVTVAAADADGDALSYGWETTCPNASIAADAAGEATFTVGDAASVCLISVRVAEAEGAPDHPGFVEGKLQVMVQAIDPELGPTITFAYMTPKYVVNGVSYVDFEAYAIDPDGDALTWTWTIDAGASDETLAFVDGSATMTVGSCAAAPMIAAAVSDGVYSSVVKFYPTCPP